MPERVWCWFATDTVLSKMVRKNKRESQNETGHVRRVPSCYFGRHATAPKRFEGDERRHHHGRYVSKFNQQVHSSTSSTPVSPASDRQERTRSLVLSIVSIPYTARFNPLPRRPMSLPLLAEYRCKTLVPPELRYLTTGNHHQPKSQ